MDPLGESPWADAPAQPPPSSDAAGAGDNDNNAANKSSSSNDPASSATLGAGSSSGGGGPRPSRLTPRRLVAQPTKLQAVEDDPLGPLGAGGDAAIPGSAAAVAAEGEPPMPPQKEPAALASTLPVRTTMMGGAATGATGATGAAGAAGAVGNKRAAADPHRIDDDDDDDDQDGGRIGGRAPPPVQAAMPVQGGARGMGPPSVSIEQAAKPSFTITVGDPHKVGDLTSSHIVYSVRTKVCFFSLETAAGLPLLHDALRLTFLF